jgi:hypothetical protein
MAPRTCKNPFRSLSDTELADLLEKAKQLPRIRKSLRFSIPEFITELDFHGFHMTRHNYLRIETRPYYLMRFMVLNPDMWDAVEKVFQSEKGRPNS